MLKEVDEDIWFQFKGDVGDTSLFVDSLYINTTAKTFGLQVAYYIWCVNAVNVLGFYLFHKGKVVKSPTNFHTCYPIVHPDYLANYSSALRDSLLTLKDFYKSITLKFVVDDSHIVDLGRDGFVLEKRFTYVKSLTEELTYSRNINRTLKKGADKEYLINLSKNPQAAFDLIWHSNRKFLRFVNREMFAQYFSTLEREGIIDYFDLTTNGNHVASILMIKDVAKKKVYSYLISIPNKLEFAEVQTMLYTYCLSYYKEQDFNTFDFSGANIPAVAAYKAKFKPVLLPYFQISYNSSYWHKFIGALKRYRWAGITERRNANA